MNGKIRIKFGPIEIDCEGSEEFLKGEFLDLLKAVSILAKESGMNSLTNNQTDSQGEIDSLNGELKSTEAIAAKLKTSTGPELIIAAAAKLIVVDAKKQFTRKELTSEMRSAGAYFKKTFVDNLTKYLNALVKDTRLNPINNSTYALTASELNSLRQKLV